MFRKITFITISIFQIDIFSKSILLISLSLVSSYLIIVCRPFILKELNLLEFHSNIAALATIFCGSLYLNDISDEFKAFLFFLIIFTNGLFAVNFVSLLLSLILMIYFDKFSEMCPKFFQRFIDFLNKWADILSRALTWKNKNLKAKNKKSEFRGVIITKIRENKFEIAKISISGKGFPHSLKVTSQF